MSGTEEASSKTDDVSEVITPGSPSSDFDSSDPNTPFDGTLADTPSPSEQPKRIPSLHAQTGYGAHMNPNSTPGGTLNMARRPHPMSSFAGSAMDNSAFAKARALAQSRSQSRPSLGSVNAGTPQSASSPQSPAGGPNGFPGAGMPGLSRPPIGHPRSAPVVQPSSLSQRRGPMKGMKLSDMGGGSPSPGLSRPGAPKLSDMGGLGNASDPPPKSTSKMDDFKKYIDTEKGWITFDGAATITSTGVNFQNGQTFSISLDEVEILNELGKGNYGTVYKVKHSKPRVPRFGQGLSGAKPAPLVHSYTDPTPTIAEVQADGTTGVTMAMKEIRLELDDAKFTTILKELVILHECVSPYIIDFYGAFFQEGAVYICIEYMDGGSIDKLYSGGIPENVLRKITYSTVHGLKSLKDDHNIIHRDVKPTNILANTKGQVKICDFGVSGNLVASMARTNIGCQSYMAPERISGGGMAANGNADGTYSVQSDVWSLGLTIIECATGRYPYPPEVSSTIFSQLSVSLPGRGILTSRLTKNRLSSKAILQICHPKAIRTPLVNSSRAACTRS